MRGSAARLTVGQLSNGDGHGFLLTESEEAFVGFPAGHKPIRLIQPQQRNKHKNGKVPGQGGGCAQNQTVLQEFGS